MVVRLSCVIALLLASPAPAGKTDRLGTEATGLAVEQIGADFTMASRSARASS